MTLGALTAATVVTGVGMCIDAQLDATPESGGGLGRNPTMRRCLLVPGNIAWDGCDCGQLALTIQRIYPSQRFPGDQSEEPATGGCVVGPRAVQALASLTRCVPALKVSLGGQGVIPSCADLLPAGIVMAADAYAMDLAVRCCLAQFKTDRVIWDYRVGGVNFVGPEGACAGVELTFKFQLM